MALASWLKPGKKNVFHQIEDECAKAKAKGTPLYRFDVGLPSGPAFLSARQAAADAVLSDAESMHTYQKNGSPALEGRFEREFVLCHAPSLRKHLEKVDFLPLPGMKNIFIMIPLACGVPSEYPGRFIYTMTNPGYPPSRDICPYLGIQKCVELVTNPKNAFLFDPVESNVSRGSVIIMNYPHNPSGQVMNKAWLRNLCGYCEGNCIRLVNDAAYAILDHTGKRLMLSDIAVDFPNLSWVEMFSASKAGNFTGWRVGALVGSPDFMTDIARVKADIDSGFAGPLAAGVLHTFENHPEEIEAMRQTYEHRLGLVIKTLDDEGMNLAFKPKAGAFSLWYSPYWAFGQKIENAKHFNYLLIEKTGVVATDFHPYIRFSSFGDVEPMLSKLKEAFEMAAVSY